MIDRRVDAGVLRDSDATPDQPRALLAAAVEGAVPAVELRNAAVPGTRYPMTGLGLAH